ncbi:MAG TPA: hypothetical protein VNH64_10410, partial [Parvularculaceae bacterium]|nr:hypothetical protein [Parvularculaceae bacterium]
GPHVRCLVQKSRREQDTWRALSYEMPPSVNGLVVNIPALSLVRRRLRVAGAQTFVVGGGIVYVMVLKYGPEGVNLAPEPDASVLPATGARVA